MGSDEEPEKTAPTPSRAGAPPEAKPPPDAPPDEPAPDGASRPSVAPRSRGWREEVVGTSLFTAAVGVWLIVSPEALGYGAGDTRWNPVVGGALVVVLSLGRFLGPWRTRALSVILFALGAWLALSAFPFEAPIAGQWNQASFGGVVALLSLIGLAGAQRGTELDSGSA